MTETAARGLCIGCNYPLQGLSSKRCPECGREFDAADPATVNMGRPIGRLARICLRRIGILNLVLAIASTIGLLSVCRWPLHIPLPTTAEWYYYTGYLKELALSRKPAYLVTTTGMVFMAASLLWAAAMLGWLLHVLLRLVVVRRHRPSKVLVPRQGGRHLLLAVMFLLGAWALVFGWPYRLGELWVARVETIPVPPGQPMPSLAGVSFPTLFCVRREHQAFRAAIMQLPERRQRVIGLKLLIERRATSALPILIEAVQHETDPVVRIHEIHLMGLYRDLSAGPVLDGFLSHPDPETRAAAADALGILHKPAFAIPVWPGQGMPPLLPSEPPIDLGRIILLSNVVGPNARRAEQISETLNDAPIPLPDARRRLLFRQMVEGSTVPEREAAARALLPWPPPDYQLRCAEWSVWAFGPPRSRPIPAFVHGSDHRDPGAFGSCMSGTPVVRLTASEPLAAQVFARCYTPLWAFPKPDEGLTMPPSLGVHQSLKSSFIVRDPYAWLVDPRDAWQPSRSMQSKYKVLWQSLIVSPQKLSWMALPVMPAGPQYQWWAQLRSIPASYVSNFGEAERLLCYGPVLANWRIKIALDRGAIDVETPGGPYWRPVTPEPPPQRQVHTPETPRSFTCFFLRIVSGQLAACRMPLPGADATLFIPGSRLLHDNDATVFIPDSKLLRGEDAIRDFRAMLVSAGLTAEEAGGLIDTWKQDFFQKEGRRLLVLMPKEELDAVCPIHVSPPPTSLVRVGVVLFEF